MAKSKDDRRTPAETGGSAALGVDRRRRRVLQGTAAMAALSAAGLQGFPRSLFAQSGEHPLKGESIDMSVLGIAGWTPSALAVEMSPLFAEYAKKNFGYDVSFSFESAPFSALFQKAATSLATRSQEYNIIISDSQWLGAFAQPGWIVNASELIAEHPVLDVDWFAPVVESAYQIYPDGSDQKWGFPQEGDTIVLFVRTDMLEDPAEQDAFQKEYGRPLPQTFEDFEALTMAQFEDVAAFFTRPDQNLYGTAMQYSREYDFISCYLYPFMWSQGGEVWNEETGQVYGILNSEVNARAMEQMKHWLQYQPPGAINFGISQEIDAFTQGTLFSAFQWAAVGPAMITEDLQGKVMAVPPPKHGTGESADRVYTVGGQPWVINRFNDEQRMRVAIDFLKWWYLPETQLEYARRGGNPCDQATLQTDGFNDIQPWFRAYRFMLDKGRSRDFWHHPQYSQMLSVQQEAFTSYMTGQTEDPMRALEYAACAQQRILNDAGTASEPPPESCSTLTL